MTHRVGDPLIMGNTYRFMLTAKKDGEIWPLTGATIKLFLQDPSGNVDSHDATILDADAGTAYYDSSVGDLDQRGRWKRSWEISQSGVVQECDPIRFIVKPGQA